MIKSCSKIIFSLTIILTALMCGQYTSFAEENTQGTYSIKPLFGADQNPNINNYYHIQTDKDLKGKYNIEITNRSDEPLALTVESLNGFTGSNGLIQYSKGKASGSSYINSEAFEFTKYVDITDKIKVKPNSVSTFSFEVNIPKQEGSVLGGLSFRTVSEGDKAEGSGVSIQINNEINNIIAFHVEFGSSVLNAVEFDDAYLFHSEFDTHVTLPVRAHSSGLVENVSVNYAVFDTDGNEMFSDDGNPLRIHLVPDADFDLHIPWIATSFSAETDYTLVGTLSVQGEEVKSFPFSKKFKYDKTAGESEFTQMQGGVLMESDDSLTVRAIIIIVSVIIAIIVTLVLYLKYKRARQELVEIMSTDYMSTEDVATADDGSDVDEDIGGVHHLNFIRNAKSILDPELNEIHVPRYSIEEELLNDRDNIIVSTAFYSHPDGIELTPDTFPVLMDEMHENSNPIYNIDIMEDETEWVCLHGIYIQNEDSKYELIYIVVPD